AVERQREKASLRDPEVFVETPFQSGRLFLEAIRPIGIVPDLAGQARRSTLRVVDVALDLAGGARQRGQRAVGEGDRIPRILPALVFEPRFLAPFVLDVPVAVAISVAI